MSTRVKCEDCEEGRVGCPECLGVGKLAYGRRGGLPFFDVEMRCDNWCMDGKVHCPKCEGEAEYTPADEEVAA